MVTSAPNVGEVARSRLFEDLRRFSKGLPQAAVSPELGLEIVFGIMVQLMGAFGEGRLSRRHREDAIRAILRAIGLDAREVKSVVARLPSSMDGGLALAPGKSSKPGRRRSAGSAT
jgi:hypothetical protein